MKSMKILPLMNTPVKMVASQSKIPHHIRDRAY